MVGLELGISLGNAARTVPHEALALPLWHPTFSQFRGDGMADGVRHHLSIQARLGPELPPTRLDAVDGLGLVLLPLDLIVPLQAQPR